MMAWSSACRETSEKSVGQRMRRIVTTSTSLGAACKTLLARKSAGIHQSTLGLFVAGLRRADLIARDRVTCTQCGQIGGGRGNFHMTFAALALDASVHDMTKAHRLAPGCYTPYDSRYSATRSSGGSANVPTIGFTIFTKSFQRMAMASRCVPALNTISGSRASLASTNTVCPK